IDVVIAITADDVERIVALFYTDYHIDEQNIRESLAHESIFNLIHHESVSKEDLIISKLFWAKESRSEIQFGDVRNLLASGYDGVYLQRWTRELGLDSLLK